MDSHISYSLQCGREAHDVFTSLKFEAGIYGRKPMEEGICQVCHGGDLKLVKHCLPMWWFFMK